MKKLVLITSIIIQSISAQNNLERADMLYNRARYNDAIELYKQIEKKNKSREIVEKIANCYYYNGKMKNAAKWYIKLIKKYKDKVKPDNYFCYAQSLNCIKTDINANAYLKEYYRVTNQTRLYENFEAKQNDLDNIKAIGDRFDIKTLGINTDASEFGAIVYDSLLIYTAPRSKKKNIFGKKYHWNGESYLDLYKIPLKERFKSNENSKLFLKGIHSFGHDAMIVFNKEKTKAYFTKSSSKKGKNRIGHLKIYIADVYNGELHNIKPISINNNSYSLAHPAISSDGRILYFSSDMPGGYGSFDLYGVDIFGHNTFGEPYNLGEKINTLNREQFPFISEKGNLYFASNGHLGLGALDIFISYYNKENRNFNDPINLGTPINGVYDDFSYYENEKGKGFFASNRPSNKKNDNIYEFREAKPLIIEECSQFVKATVIDKISKKPIENASVKIFLDSVPQKTIQTKKDGSIIFKTLCDVAYKMNALKESYHSNDKEILTKSIRKDTLETQITLYSFADEIRQKKVDSIQEKKRQIEEKKQRRANIIKNEKMLFKKDGEIQISVRKIFFDYNLSYVRLESRKNLVPLITLMKKYPEIKIQIQTHTDLRGSKKYNELLSQDRANSIKKYLEQRGIDSERISAIGKGESEPILKKPEEECSEEDHEINRRCEFIITDF